VSIFVNHGFHGFEKRDHHGFQNGIPENRHQSPEQIKDAEKKTYRGRDAVIPPPFVS
jgi:hypothetical protein